MNHAERRVADGDGLGGVERTDDEGDEIRRHLHGVGEREAPAAAGGGLVRHLARVRHRGEVLGDVERHREHRLEVGLVPAREGLAGVRGLELGDRDDMFVAGFVRESRPVEASELVVEHTGEAIVQDPGAHLERLVDREPGPLGLRFERHRGRPAWPSSGRFEPRVVDLELGGIEDDLVNGVDHLDGDPLFAAERGGVELGRDRELVAGRNDRSRQAVTVRFGHGCLRYRP